MKKLPFFALLALTGCAFGSSAEQVYLPNGTTGYRITCGGYLGNMSDCIQKAGDICGPNGYQMYDAAGKPLSALAQDQSVIAALNSPSSRHGSSDAKESMFVKCRLPPPNPNAVPPLAPVDTQPIPLERQ